MKKILLSTIFVVTILVAILVIKILLPEDQSTANPSLSSNKPTQQLNSKIESTNPNPLEGAIILPTQKLEIKFTQKLPTSGDFTYRIEPSIDLNISLQPDRQTVWITPKESWEVGREYILTIIPDTHFENGQKLDSEQVFHFKTIIYKGV